MPPMTLLSRSNPSDSRRLAAIELRYPLPHKTVTGAFRAKRLPDPRETVEPGADPSQLFAKWRVRELSGGKEEPRV